MALPFPEDRFDAVVMALVMFSFTDPTKAVAEMVRVVAPGRDGRDHVYANLMAAQLENVEVTVWSTN